MLKSKAQLYMCILNIFILTHININFASLFTYHMIESKIVGKKKKI